MKMFSQGGNSPTHPSARITSSVKAAKFQRNTATVKPLQVTQTQSQATGNPLLVTTRPDQVVENGIDSPKLSQKTTVSGHIFTYANQHAIG